MPYRRGDAPVRLRLGEGAEGSVLREERAEDGREIVEPRAPDGRLGEVVLEHLAHLGWATHP